MTSFRTSETRQNGSRESVRRDAWRADLFHEQIAEEMAQRRRAGAMRLAVMVGVALGVIGSVLYL